MLKLKQIFRVKVEKRFHSMYNGPTEWLESDDFRIQRSNPLQKWILLDSFGIGWEPGDIFDYHFYYPFLQPGVHFYQMGGGREWEERRLTVVDITNS